MVVIPILLFGGVVVNINDIPEFIRWLQYFSPMRHAFLIIFQDQMSTNIFSQYSPLNLPKVYGIDGNSLVAFFCSTGLLVLYFTLSIVILNFSIKRKL